MQNIKGKFDVDLTPQEDHQAPVGRMVIHKRYSGALTGEGKGQMISKRTEGGTAIYFAVEEFDGSVDGRAGTFTLTHNGSMTKDAQHLDVQIVEGSGGGGLVGITGSMDILQQDGEHFYVLKYAL